MSAAAPLSLLDKLWLSHLVRELPGGTALLAIDRVMLHERTGSVALRGLAASGRPVLDPRRAFCTMDHVVDTRPGRGDATLMPGGEAFISATRAATREAGIRLFDVDDPDQGIVHVISPELGIVLPGLTLVCPDSHTCTQGAFGALAWGIGSTEAEHALATGTLRMRRPRSVRVTLTGAVGAGVTAKDLALTLITRYGADGGSGAVLEFCGPAVTAMDMTQRMTLCNMATEFAAVSALIAPDERTLDWLQGRRYAPVGETWERAVKAWQQLASDPEARFDAEWSLDATEVAPMVTWGTSPEQAVAVLAAVPLEPRPNRPTESYQRALHYMGLQPGQPLAGLPLDAAFIGSCTNSRLEDLRRAASVLRGRRIAPGLRAICVPGSTRVRREAEAEGLHEVFLAAGFEWREAGCSMCFFAGGEHFGTRERVISSTNRNFESRQGPATRTHLASPETVAASAVAGCITDPRPLLH
ncbi:MAG: 3-isopropylmalate dehydratase large subunit [Steroidobacteraceae bacterium]